MTKEYRSPFHNARYTDKDQYGGSLLQFWMVCWTMTMIVGRNGKNLCQNRFPMFNYDQAQAVGASSDISMIDIDSWIRELRLKMGLDYEFLGFKRGYCFVFQDRTLALLFKLTFG